MKFVLQQTLDDLWWGKFIGYKFDLCPSFVDVEKRAHEPLTADYIQLPFINGHILAIKCKFYAAFINLEQVFSEEVIHVQIYSQIYQHLVHFHQR